MEEWKGGRFCAALPLICHFSGANDGAVVILEACCGISIAWDSRSHQEFHRLCYGSTAALIVHSINLS